MYYFLGSDIGTSSSKTILTDLTGKLISQDTREYDVLTPKRLWAEQWPEVWMDGLVKSIRNTVNNSGVDSKDIKGITISGLYGGSGVPVDEEIKAIRPCLIWMDRRADQETNWVLDNVGLEKLIRITHNGVDPYYGFTKMLWIKFNEPENWKRIRYFLPPNSYAIYKLTGEIAIDYSSAGNIGGIFDMNERKWSEDLLNDMDIPVRMMPSRLVNSTEIVGQLTNEAAEDLGLALGTPVFFGGVDCGAATLGMGVLESGVFAVTIGTSMCGALICDKNNLAVESGKLIAWPYQYEPLEYSYLFSGANTAGAIIKWFRNTFAENELLSEKAGGKNAYDQLNEIAQTVPLGSNGLVVLPYFMGERAPIWDSDAKGVIFGLSLNHTKAHIYRAFLEAIAFSLRDSIEASGNYQNDHILVSGGVTKSLLFRQILADVTGYIVYSPNEDVEANLGDVMLAAIGTGLLSQEEVAKWQVMSNRTEPIKDNYENYEQYYRLYHEIYKCLRTPMAQLSTLV